MLAVFCLAARRDAHAVANGQGDLSWPVCLEPPGKPGRRLDFLADDQPRSLVAAWGILVELEQVARIILGQVRFLRIRQVSGNPCINDALLAELALRDRKSTRLN